MMKNRECPECRKLGRDSAGDHLFLMEDGETWCCNKKEIHPLYLEKEGGEPISTDSRASPNWYKYRLPIKEIVKLPMTGSEERMISKETHEKFRVRTEFSESTGQPKALFYPETYKGNLGSFKCRDLPKKFNVAHRFEEVPDGLELFGQHRCPKNGRKIILCAGEEDTLAAYEMLYEYKPEYEPAAVGMPRGESGVAVVADNMEFLKGFETVIIAMDEDDAGRKALEKLAVLIGERARVLSICENDLSDMRTRGKEKQFITAFFEAKEYRPSSIVHVGDILEQAIQPVKWGLSYPWDYLTELTYGIKEQGEIIGVGAAPGAGKSTIWQMIQKHLIFAHKEPIAVFEIEEGAEIGLKKLIGSCMNKPIHKPECEYSLDEARIIGQSFDGLVQFYGGDSENWDEVDDAIRYFASKGITKFFIDPLSALVEHLTASEGNQELGKIMRSMRKFRKHQGLTFFHANHLNNPSTGKEHGEGGKVLGSQFSGSRAQWKYSTLLLGFERNQYADDPIERNLGTLRVIKDRLGGNTGIVPLQYEVETGNLVEREVTGEF